MVEIMPSLQKWIIRIALGSIFFGLVAYCGMVLGAELERAHQNTANYVALRHLTQFDSIVLKTGAHEITVPHKDLTASLAGWNTDTQGFHEWLSSAVNLLVEKGKQSSQNQAEHAER
jgi:hypothetical protein